MCKGDIGRLNVGGPGGGGRGAPGAGRGARVQVVAPRVRLLAVVADRARAPRLRPAVLALLGAAADTAVGEAMQLLSRPSFSAAMARTTP